MDDEQPVSAQVYAAGIIGALWVYGLLQERIMSQPYDGAMFGDSVLLTCKQARTNSFHPVNATCDAIEQRLNHLWRSKVPGLLQQISRDLVPWPSLRSPLQYT